MNCAVILAAGKGTRYKEQKQFIKFREKVLWQHVYDKVITIIPKEHVVVVGVQVQGGETRSESVRIGIQELYKRKQSYERILVLEAARPLVTTKQLKEILAVKSPSCTYVHPLVNTMISKDGTYLNRDDWYEMTSPNAFDFKVLKEAYDGKNEINKINMTDDTRVIYEYSGIKPTLLQGHENLFKLTYPKDISTLEMLAKLYGMGE